MKKILYKNRKGGGSSDDEKIKELRIQLTDVKMEEQILLEKLKKNKQKQQKIETQLYELEQDETIKSLPRYRGRYALKKKHKIRTSKNDWGKWDDDWSSDMKSIIEETKSDLEKEV